MNRTHMLAVALLGATSLSTPALAQLPTAPPPRLPVDAQGVNLADGSFNYSHTDLSIGPVNGGLAYVHSYGATGETNNFNFQVRETPSSATVTIGTIADYFSKSGTTFTSTTGSGATLTETGGTNNTFTYTTADGTVYMMNNQTQSFGAPLRFVQSVTTARGYKLAFSYKTIFIIDPNCTQQPCQNIYYSRLSSINNSNGYQLKFFYKSNTHSEINQWLTLTNITAINNAVDYCDPSADSCSGLTEAWPSVGIAYGANTETYTDAMGHATVYTIPTSGLLTGIQRPMSSAADVSVAYDSSSRVSSVTIDGAIWTYSFTLSGSTMSASTTDPLSHVRTTTADNVQGNILTDKNALNKITTYTYDSGGNIKTITMPEGNEIKYDRDGRENVTTTTYISKTPGTPANIVTTANYDATCTYVAKCNLSNWTKDTLGNQTDYTYDNSTGNILTVTQPAPTSGGVRPQTRYSYTSMQAYFKDGSGSIVASGQPIAMLTGVSVCRTTATCATPGSETADETKSIISYGSQTTGTANNLLPVSATVTDGLNTPTLTATTGYGYDDSGNLSTTTDPLSNVTTYFFDADRNALGSIGADPDGTGSLKRRAIRLTYNADGLVTLAEQGTAANNTLSAFNAISTLQQVATTYDSADRKIEDSYASGGGTVYSITQYSYDAASRPDCTALRMDTSTYAGTLPGACLLTSTTSLTPDRIDRNVYDAANQLLKVRNAYGVTTTNGFPRTLQRNVVTYTYSDDGKVTSLADAANNLTTYVYDGFERLSQTQYPSPTTPGSSNTADYELYRYDANSNLTGRRLRGSTLATGSYDIGYGVDALNRVTSIVFADSEPTDRDVTYSYDLLGHLLLASTGANHNVQFAYDALGRPTSETSLYAAKTMGYDLDNQMTRLTWPDGFFVNYDYDNIGEMTAIRENGATNPPTIPLALYAYDDLGNRKSRTLGNGTSTTYGYHPGPYTLATLALGGGTSTNTVTFNDYSPAGEIGSRANSNDAYVWTGGVTGSIGYAANGLNQYTTFGATTPTYDVRGNMTGLGSATYFYNSQNELVVHASTSLFYDALGRLDSDQPDGLRFDYLGGHILTELSYSGSTIQRRYVYGPGDDEPIVSYEGSGTTTRRYMDQDERGSVTRITDDSGATVAVNSYDEYGQPSSGNAGRFQYTGQAWLPSLGLYYYKNRMYAPTVGRFMQTDPIGYAGEPNWYNYVGSDPINFVDPMGFGKCYYEETHTEIYKGFSDGHREDVGDEPGSEVRTLRCYNEGTSGGTKGGISQPNSTPQKITPACARALVAAGNMSTIIGLPLDGSKSLALQALATGTPAALRITNAGMQIANQYVHDNPGLLSRARPYGPGLTAYQINFGATAYGGVVNGQGSGPLGALLGRATVIINDGGDVVGIKDIFDYDPSNASFPINAGMAAANGQISAACSNRVASVPVSGGVVH